MSPYLQHTLAGPVTFSGVGIHSGEAINLSLLPGGVDTGIVFRRVDVTVSDPLIPARAENVCQTRLGTVIGNADGVRVATVEHLMAALCGAAIDNVVVEIDGPEVPIMDGSCLPFLDRLQAVGARRQEAVRRYIEILSPVAAEEGDKRASLTPAQAFEVAFEILFDAPAIGRQRIDLVVDGDSFRTDLADSRTFGFLHEVEALRAAGLARGGSLDNVVVIENGAVMNPGGVRRTDEFVRHKALDAIGDLYLLGAPLLGRYEGVYAGHGLNNALARVLLAAPACWRWSTAPLSLARAG